MIIKILLFICVQTLLLEVVSSQCINEPELANDVSSGLASFFYGPACFPTASRGGGLQVTSFSPLAPTGLSIISENTIEGPVFVGGWLPFLAAVALGGAFPSVGLGSISYGCGDDAVGIVSEGPIATGIIGPYGAAGLGYRPDLFYGPGLFYGPDLFYVPDLFYGPGPTSGPVGFGPGLGYEPGFAYGPDLAIPAYVPVIAGFDGPAPSCGVVC